MNNIVIADDLKIMYDVESNRKYIAFVGIEVWVLSIVAGIYFKSWIVWVLSLFGLMFLSVIEKIRILMYIIFGLIYAHVGYFIGTLINNEGAKIALIIYFFVVGFGLHWKVFSILRKTL
ncbi:hypothetical protein KAR48_11220 [bacterium]|nr:hypothetical protein [bacterium]